MKTQSTSGKWQGLKFVLPAGPGWKLRLADQTIRWKTAQAAELNLTPVSPKQIPTTVSTQGNQTDPGPLRKGPSLQQNIT